MEVLSRKISYNSTGKLLKDIGDEALLDFVERNLQDKDQNKAVVLSVDNKFSIDNLPSPSYYEDKYDAIINLRRANDIENLVGLYSSLNFRLEREGALITCLETTHLRKERLLRKYPSLFGNMYYALDFLGKRIIPKLPVASKIYYFLTANRNRVLTSVEVLGRLVYCGFKIKEIQEIDGLLYIAVRKIEHKINLEELKYGFLFTMKRTGYKGKIITVYKLRTMNPYSEFLQDYIYSTNNLDKGGKFKDDYRVNFMGNILRKLWLDELPMFYNWLKGDIKLVGVRPLSAQYLSLYHEKLIERRRKFKPGLVPPYYADLPETIEEIMDSENRYFNAHEKAPFLTDVSYFMKALKNIIFKRARSK